MFLAKSIAQKAERLHIDELCFMDNNEQKLKIYGGMAAHVVKLLCPKMRFSITSDAVEAVTDADYVITTIRVGEDDMRARDERIALNKGILGQETTGAAGFSFAMRSVPALAEYCELIKKYSNGDIPMAIAYTKIDIMPKENIPADIKLLYENGIDCDVFPVSARKRTNIAKLEKYLADRLPQGEKVISEDIVSDKSEKFMISEIMREKILLKFSEEIPHGVAISVNVFKKQENGVYDINLDIVCEKPNHKAIIIGKQGKALKEVASFARQDMEKFLGAKVFLTTYVKVKEDWRNRLNILTELGYND